MDGIEVSSFLLPSIIVIALGTAITFGVVKANARVDCLEQGYPDIQVTWKLDAYCISPHSNLTSELPKVIKLED